MSDPADNERGDAPLEPAEGVGDALRQAVERTLAVTAEGASGTRRRAQDLLDDAVRRSQVAREQVAKRGEEATSRLAEAIGELRSVDDESIARLSSRLEALEARIAALEAGSGVLSQAEVEGEEAPAAPHQQRESGT